MPSHCTLGIRSEKAHRLSVALQGPVASTEVELLEAARREGKATVAAGVTIELTKALAVCDDPSNVFKPEEKHSEISLRMSLQGTQG